MFNTKQFIKEVLVRPCLWNVNVKEYTDRFARQSAWEDVAQVVYKDKVWENLGKKERSEKIRDLKKKWKGLRDYFTRGKNRDRARKTGARQNRRTPLLDMLSFLNLTKETIQSPKNQRVEKMSKKDLESTKSLPTRSEPKSLQMDPLEIMDRPKDDPDMNFLLSILPDMKAMTTSQNFEFRFEVMSLIKNMKYNQFGANYYYNSSESTTFTHQLPEYTPEMDLETDRLSSESRASSTDYMKEILKDSLDNNPLQ